MTLSGMKPQMKLCELVITSADFSDGTTENVFLETEGLNFAEMARLFRKLALYRPSLGFKLNKEHHFEERERQYT